MSRDVIAAVFKALALLPVTGGAAVLFDLAPKRSRGDLYNYEYELEQLHRFYLSSRVVTVLGCRRIGKTSLILTFLNEWKVPPFYRLQEGLSLATELTLEVL